MGKDRSTMTAFWKDHSQQATVEEMMLDSNAQQLTKHELPEILDMLPNLDGVDVLELGAGIGLVTSVLLLTETPFTGVKSRTAETYWVLVVL